MEHRHQLGLEKRCIIEELAEDANIQGLKVVTSQSQSQHLYTDLGPETEIEYEALVNEPAKNEALVREDAENDDLVNEPIENEDNQN
ncbi:hypothetical protein PanWU01x14_255490 [Parasponia andersonii]|uniref:Uncharacterized protein n=1 Tax=Parasponia andersonii TaxID=3476 RepID=A0A2P5BAR7_PARAD|nr:hypothetical protein PanWU01x14_255490 [Parasponia andersonii]